MLPVPPRWVDELFGSAASGSPRQGDVDVRTSGVTAHATVCIADAVSLESQALRVRVTSAYRAIIDSLERIGRHPARFWNFIPDIGEPMSGGLVWDPS